MNQDHGIGRAVTLVSLSFGLALLMMKQAKSFLEFKRTNQNALARQVLRVLWVITALSCASWIVIDFSRL